MRIRRGIETDESGFSLIEVLVAIAILAIGLLAIGSMQLATVRNTTNSNTITQAIMLANQKMEEVKNTPDFTTLADEDEENIDANGNPGGIYNRNWHIDPLGTSSRRISVIVEWTKFGSTRRVIVRSNTMGNGV